MRAASAEGRKRAAFLIFRAVIVWFDDAQRSHDSEPQCQTRALAVDSEVRCWLGPAVSLPVCQARNGCVRHGTGREGSLL
jgi:hypothetical protein